MIQYNSFQEAFDALFETAEKIPDHHMDIKIELLQRIGATVGYSNEVAKTIQKLSESTAKLTSAILDKK